MSSKKKKKVFIPEMQEIKEEMAQKQEKEY